MGRRKDLEISLGEPSPRQVAFHSFIHSFPQQQPTACFYRRNHGRPACWSEGLAEGPAGLAGSLAGSPPTRTDVGGPSDTPGGIPLPPVTSAGEFSNGIALTLIPLVLHKLKFPGRPPVRDCELQSWPDALGQLDRPRARKHHHIFHQASQNTNKQGRVYNRDRV